MKHKLLSKFVRVGVEGVTVDGREITRQQIEEMAATYDVKVFGARIWPEHFRGLIPGGPFDALGDVVALKAEEIKEGGELDGKLALYAQLEPLPELVKMNRAGQKVYTSLEVITNFAKTSKAYFVGLAVTDSPASQGTERLNFSSDGGSDVFVGKSVEVELEFTEQKEETEKPSLFSKIQGILSRKNKDDNERYSDIEQSITTVAESQQDTLDSIDLLTNQLETAGSAFSQLKKAHDELLTKFTTLSDKLNSQENPTYSQRPAANGGNGDNVTDC